MENGVLHFSSNNQLLACCAISASAEILVMILSLYYNTLEFIHVITTPLSLHCQNCANMNYFFAKFSITALQIIPCKFH